MMKMSAAVVLVVSLAAVVAAGPMKLYEKSPDATYKQVLVPVSSTVIPLEELPVFKVGAGVGVVSPILVDEKLRPDGPVKLVTIHSLRRDKKKNKKVEPEKEGRAADIEELTEEEFRALTQQQEGQEE
ncbi:uncharacterized protein LOC126981495 [Eriocheir sinensis]|uniref:uncharacterized protein LOC126981495 n=1 Tax=Eriocheir sinensis TaxID=95602 RepID=UPI0021C69696|nr:uncharacterized protein LOC126981495 [Eriocheir sinensis]